MSDSRQWLSPEGNFLFGKYEGRSLKYVSIVDHSYIRWVVESANDISDKDREKMKSLLSFRLQETEED